MTKNGKKETRHLVAGADAAITICGRPVGKVLLWAKKYEPGAETMSVCGRCRALKAGRARTEKIVKKHEAIRAAGKKETGSIPDVPYSPAPKLGKRTPALAILGDRMPEKLAVTFKGNTITAKVIHNPMDSAIHGRIMLLEPDGTPYGDSYGSPSRAGKAVAGREIDGWTFWSYLKADGTLEKLDALRKAVA